jgi:hypothetical protein
MSGTGLELPGRRAVLLERHVEMLPLPRDLQTLDVVRIDVCERRVLGAALIAAVIQPLDLLAGVGALGRHDWQREQGGNRRPAEHYAFEHM